MSIPQSGGKMSKHLLGGIKGYKYKTSSLFLRKCHFFRVFCTNNCRFLFVWRVRRTFSPHGWYFSTTLWLRAGFLTSVRMWEFNQNQIIKLNVASSRLCCSSIVIKSWSKEQKQKKNFLGDLANKFLFFRNNPRRPASHIKQEPRTITKY